VVGLSSGVAAVAAGFRHACALSTAGAVLCWGDNASGQLGNGSTTPSTTPVAVSGLGSGVLAIAAGFAHSCALTSAAVMCWGDNSAGQIGIGSTTTATRPVAVAGLGSGVKAVSAGYRHTCAITQVGAAQCWGDNPAGQLGNGGTANATTPVAVSGLGSGVTAVSAGFQHTCAVLDGGVVACWGDNSSGQLGNGSTVASTTPVTLSGPSGATALATGSAHSCAIFNAGAVLCWGYNHFGTLGNHSFADTSTPVAITGLSYVALSGAGDSTCGVTLSGATHCWGLNDSGQLGAYSSRFESVPVPICTTLAAQCALQVLRDPANLGNSELRDMLEHTSAARVLHQLAFNADETAAIDAIRAVRTLVNSTNSLDDVLDQPTLAYTTGDVLSAADAQVPASVAWTALRPRLQILLDTRNAAIAYLNRAESLAAKNDQNFQSELATAQNMLNQQSFPPPATSVPPTSLQASDVYGMIQAGLNAVAVFVPGAEMVASDFYAGTGLISVLESAVAQPAPAAPPPLTPLMMSGAPIPNVFNVAIANLRLVEQANAAANLAALEREKALALKDIGLLNALTALNVQYDSGFETPVAMPCRPLPSISTQCTGSETISPLQRALDVSQAGFRKAILTQILPIMTVLYGEEVDSPDPWQAADTFDHTICPNDPACDEYLAFSGLRVLVVRHGHVLTQIATSPASSWDFDDYEVTQTIQRWRLAFWSGDPASVPIFASQVSTGGISAWSYVRTVFRPMDVRILMARPGAVSVVHQTAYSCNTAVPTLSGENSSQTGSVGACVSTPYNGLSQVYWNMRPASPPWGGVLLEATDFPVTRKDENQADHPTYNANLIAAPGQSNFSLTVFQSRLAWTGDQFGPLDPQRWVFRNE
jgi:alpha-tubulin suppressor-like RCC1 family protein